jgi:hypothetical protein
MSLTLANTTNNFITKDMTHVTMSDNTILDLSHIEHATWSLCHAALYYFLVKLDMPYWT